MSNKPKAQGTKAETRIVRLHQDVGIPARRLSEGGKDDEGDVEIAGYWSHSLEEGLARIVGEVRDREKMNALEALERATAKSGTHHTALFWSQPVKGGLLRRRRRGVLISESFWLELIGGHQPGILEP